MSMFSSLGRSWDSKFRNGIRARQLPAGAHAGNRDDFLRRHELEASQVVHQPREEQERFLAKLLGRVADTRMLKIAFDDLKRQGGQAPGPNGLCYEDLDDFEVWDMIETLSESIKDGTYRPGPTRSVEIPKTSGGTRTLTLANIEDRVVAKAVQKVIQPVLDPTFDDCSFGCRPGRGRLDALAEAKYLAEAQGRQIWVIEDVQSAFDNVPLKRLKDLLRKRLPEELCELIIRLVCRKVKEKETKNGIQQGCALSPMLLNLYLDHHLDRVWKRKFPDLPLLRTADDILVPVAHKKDVRRATEGLRELLPPAGMPIQEEKSQVAHLANGDKPVWLGYQLSLEDNELDVRIPGDSWRKLEEAFFEAYESPSPSLKAEACLMGWLAQQGPAFPHHVEALPLIYELASRYGHEELPETGELTGIWEEAHGKWEHVHRNYSPITRAS